MTACFPAKPNRSSLFCCAQVHASAAHTASAYACPLQPPSDTESELSSLCAQVHASAAHAASVNALSFAPHELGLALAAASSDGSISVLTHTAEAGWHTEKVSAGGVSNDHCTELA